MSFVQSHADPAARVKAVVGVGGVHAILGVALVIGLTFTGRTAIDEKFTAIPIRDPAPEVKTTPPETAVEAKESYLPPVAPTSKVVLTPDMSETVRPLEDPQSDYHVDMYPNPLPTPTYAPNPPRATPTTSPVSARPRNGPTGWITNDDYPRAGITRELEGVAGYRLVIGSDGRVDDCQITGSTGHTVLDRATCQLIERRARFEPATDQTGRTVVGTYDGQVTWDIPD